MEFKGHAITGFPLQSLRVSSLSLVERRTVRAKYLIHEHNTVNKPGEGLCLRQFYPRSVLPSFYPVLPSFSFALVLPSFSLVFLPTFSFVYPRVYQTSYSRLKKQTSFWNGNCFSLTGSEYWWSFIPNLLIKLVVLKSEMN